jgi:hypothetical protein
VGDSISPLATINPENYGLRAISADPMEAPREATRPANRSG